MRSEGYCSWVCVCVCLSVCLLSHISPMERLFVLKTLSRTQRATKVKTFVGFSLKPLRCRDPALPPLYGHAYSRLFFHACIYAQAYFSCIYAHDTPPRVRHFSAFHFNCGSVRLNPPVVVHAQGRARSCLSLCCARVTAFSTSKEYMDKQIRIRVPQKHPCRSISHHYTRFRLSLHSLYLLCMHSLSTPTKFVSLTCPRLYLT